MGNDRDALVRREPSTLEAPAVSGSDQTATDSGFTVGDGSEFDALLTLPEDHNEQELKRLAKAIEMSLGEFTFFFVRCDDLEEQPKWIRRIQENLPQHKIQHIELKHQEDSLLLYLRRNPISESTEAICITGLEKSVSSIYDLWNETFLRDLNLRRNSFFEEFPKPMIFLGNLDFQKRFMTKAPDFFSIRSSIFYLRTDRFKTSETEIEKKLTILIPNIKSRVKWQFPNISHESIEDIVQDALIESYKKIKNGNISPDHLSNYFFIVARHRAIDFLRKKNRIPEIESINNFNFFTKNINPTEENLFFEDHIPDNNIDIQKAVEEKQILMTALNRLTEQDKAITLLYYFEQMNIEEIALLLGTSPRSIRHKLNRGRILLKKILHDLDKQ